MYFIHGYEPSGYTVEQLYTTYIIPPPLPTMAGLQLNFHYILAHNHYTLKYILKKKVGKAFSVVINIYIYVAPLVHERYRPTTGLSQL